MLRRIGLFVLALAALGAALVGWSYHRWRAAQIARLEGGSRVAQTAKGPLEYALLGDQRRTILFLHGLPGGYDQGTRLATTANKRGYRMLTVSRPGYLRSPLSTGRSPSAQADAYAALLDTLGVARVSVIAVSGGGPSAAQFAARHPERCEALAMLSALTKPLHEPPPPIGLIEQLMRGTDFGGWLVFRQLERNPAGMLARRDPETRKRIGDDPERLASYVDLARSALVLVSRRLPGIANDREWFTKMPEPPFERIRAPTIAVHGSADTTVPIENAKLLVERAPAAKLVEIQGGSHLVSITHGEETFGPVFDLFDDVARNGASEQASARGVSGSPAVQGREPSP